MDSPIRWAGGKKWLLPYFNALVTGVKYNAFVELFAGGAALSFGREETNVVLNDINTPLMRMYYHLHKGTLQQHIQASAEEYYVIRERYNATKRSQGRSYEPQYASDFYFLNQYGFNGLYRENSSGDFNVPYGKRTHVKLKDLGKYRTLMQKWILANHDYANLQLAADDLVFADPPYDGTFTDYSAGGFSWDDQERLATILSRAPCPVVATNAATPAILEMYKDLGFNLRTLEAPRRISRNGDRTPALEMLAWRNF